MTLPEVIHQWDVSVLLAVHSYAIYPRFSAVCYLVTSSSLFRGTLLIAAYWYCWFDDPSRDPGGPEGRRVVLAGIASSLLAVILARLLADVLPFRLRPFFDPTSGFPLSNGTGIGRLENWSAFPSDTAAFALALSFGLYTWRPRISLILATYSAIVICVPRVFLGIHYPSDIVVGAAIGIIAAAICRKFVRGRPVDVILEFSERHRSWFYGAAFVISSELAIMFQNIRDVGHFVIDLLRGLPKATLLHLADFSGGLLLVAVVVMWTLHRYRARLIVNQRSKLPEKP